MHMVCGRAAVVVYSKPRGVVSWPPVSNNTRGEAPAAMGRRADLGPVNGGDGPRQRLARDDERDVVDEGLGVPGVGGAGAQLAQLGLEAGMLRDVDVGREGRHGTELYYSSYLGRYSAEGREKQGRTAGGRGEAKERKRRRGGRGGTDC